jgi:Zn-finger nucleic acid-binding protein
MTDRHGIEIDYCPSCRGVWLDRGELDKLIARGTPPVVVDQRIPQPPNYRPDYDDDDDDRSRYGHGYPQRRKKSFLSEMFDFD